MIRTQHYSKLLDEQETKNFMIWSAQNLVFTEGPKSRKQGSTRLATAIMPGEYEEVDELVGKVLSLLPDYKDGRELRSMYLNLYRDGEDFTPNHSHPKQRQIIISFGATRTLLVGKKEYKVEDGDVVVFGGSVHGVPKERQIKEARFSLALFFCLA